ncbi:A24 family peptidase [Paenibacillus senegalimassiliensis]|uniref:A24 family peptidase n=1 Tax=Paenibacillus senegalimassiliensis TaxID=1737426 RepID=UPI00073E802D
MPLEYWGCFLMLITAFITDLRTMKIPNWLTIPGIAGGIMFHTLLNGWAGGWFAVKGAGIGFALMLLLYLLRAVGGGDVKLFGAIGAWMGITLTLSMMMYSIVIAGCIGLIILLWRQETWMRLRRIFQSVFGAAVLRSVAPIQATARNQLQFPFMLAVLPGAILSVYYF